MNSTICYNDNSLDVSSLNKIIKQKINFNNVKLLETPKEIGSDNLEFTLLKVICNTDVKKFIKKIETLYHNDGKDVSIVFNYDPVRNLDYYELLLNKKILQILGDFDINEYYNIVISLVSNDMVLWKIHSLETSNNFKIEKVDNDINLVEDFEPDYQEIQNSYIIEINKLLKSNKNKLRILTENSKKLDILLNDIKNNYNIKQIEDYRSKLNSYY
tara:strand:- start:2026 stop:2670 length:645 start_codon:yes stop_codon:yes gene_type:complete